MEIKKLKGFTGRKHSKESIEKIRLGNIGKKNTDETKKIMSKLKIGKKNPMWKGKDVGYNALHNWVTRHKPKPKFCEKCGKKKPYDLANISQKYKRDVNDFEWLCRSCHMKKDGRINNLKKGAYYVI